MARSGQRDGCAPPGRPQRALGASGGGRVNAQLPDLRRRDLRHSCISLLLAQGVPLSTIQLTLGHSQIAVTMRYAHLVPELQGMAATLMDNALTSAD